MKFDDLDSKMRVYETAQDLCVLPGMYMVARIDGRGFTRLTKEICKFEAPFDEVFRNYMVETVQYLMKDTGFKITYGYTESDEISLLFDLNENSFSRKQRKLNSILAGEASAKFSLLLGKIAVFDCRICQLPNEALVVDYFRWRNEDAFRNSLNAYCYWTLRKDGYTKQKATSDISGMSVAQKNELLFSYGINFNNLPSWQKRGIGFYWDTVIKEGFNPKLNKPVEVFRKEIIVDYELPFKDNYDKLIRGIITKLT